MTKQIKFVFYCLIILTGALAASTTFFYSKSKNISKIKSNPETSVETKASPSANIVALSSPEPSTLGDIIKATLSSEEPSHPTDVYTIQKIDTLFSIAQNNGLTLSELAETNDITDSNKIQQGQKIVIPKNGQVDYTIDQDQVTILQKQVNNNRISWRLDPRQTAQADSPVIYGLKITDKYILQSNDKTLGQAIVKAESENGNFNITLIQPDIKGDKGIWALKSVKKV